MCIRYFCVHSNPPLSAVQLFVFEVFVFHENIELLPPGNSSNLSLGNCEPTEGITSVLRYQSAINLAGWRFRIMTEHRAPTPCLFFCRVFEVFNIINFFFCEKMDLAALKIMFLDRYLILYCELTYTCSVKGNNYYAKRTGLLASNEIKLSSSYIGHSLVA